MKRWSDSEIKYLKSNYSLLPTSELSDYFGRSEQAIRMKACELQLSKWNTNVLYTETGKQELIDMYVSQKLTTRNIAKTFKCDKKTISRILKKYNIDLRHKRGKNFSGEKRYMLTALEDTGEKYGTNAIWLCQCDCGNYTTVTTNNFGTTKSCGCLNFGEGHYCWNPNLTDEDRQLRKARTRKMKNWSLDVFKKDNFTCQICESYKNLNAHHLCSWDMYPELRYDINNGVTLCIHCHIAFHKRFGYGNNDKAQFNLYLEAI